jgi:hypothetical protein
LSGVDGKVADGRARHWRHRVASAINELLGRMDGAEYVSPRAPHLPGVSRSVDAREFTLAAFQTLGAPLTPKGDRLSEENGGREYMRFEEAAGSEVKSTLYEARSAAFQRLAPERTPDGRCDHLRSRAAARDGAAF